MNITVPASSYYNYSDRPRTYDYALYVTQDDPIIDLLAMDLKDDATNYSL